MLAHGRGAREAARAMREAGDAAKTKALRDAAEAIRARKQRNSGRQCERHRSGQSRRHGGAACWTGWR